MRPPTADSGRLHTDAVPSDRFAALSSGTTGQGKGVAAGRAFANSSFAAPGSPGNEGRAMILVGGTATRHGLATLNDSRLSHFFLLRQRAGLFFLRFKLFLERHDARRQYFPLADQFTLLALRFL